MHDVHNHVFGWDNESPARIVHVKRFKAEWRPVTNGEFEKFMLGGEGTGVVSMPKSWIQDEDGEYKVRTMFGPVPLDVARTWPVLTSYDDLVYYAKCKGGRLPTEPELRLFLDMYDVGYEGGANVGFRNWHPVPATTGCENAEKGSNGGVWEWTSTLFDGHDELAPTELFPGYSTDFFDTKHQVVVSPLLIAIPTR
jgi:formylglycine-generating enzyme required for sulfatase activity